MAENLMEPILNGKNRTPWYPNPDNERKSWNFIYLESLYQDHPRVFNRADSRLRNILSRINEDLYPQLDSLLKLAEREQRKEDAILDKISGSISGDARDDGQRIRAFNEIYQYYPIFERNLNKIKQVAEGGRQGRIDITANFMSYLQKAINKRIQEKNAFTLNKNNLLEITKQALIEAFSSADQRYNKNTPEDEIMRSYKELAQIVEKMENKNPFIENIFDIYFGNAFEKMEQSLKKTGEKRKKATKSSDVSKLISNARGLHGDLLEEVSTLVMNELSPIAKKGGKAIRTGSSKQKADIINLFEASFEIPEELLNKVSDGSVREYFIKQYDEFYNTLKNQKGYIVEVSAKNYNLTTEYFQDEGFSAQSITSIANFQKMLKAYRYDKKKTEDLVFALTNIGPDTLETGTEIVSHSISLMIGYFLFDDIGMDFAKDLDVKAIHLFNLDGIYIPLSSFLFAAYDTLKDFDTLNRDMVSVRYQPDDIGYEKDPTPGSLTQKKWQETVLKKQNQDNISVHFFKKFPQYIAQRIK